MSTTDHTIEYVTATIGGQLFGLPISGVQDVFMPERLTRVPLAAPEFAGMLNLRGRIVTAVDMRLRLGLPPVEAGKARMAIGIEGLARVSAGVYRLDGNLLVVLDVDRVLDIGAHAEAA
jgi:purine-binding chemotaxis protein CheW